MRGRVSAVLALAALAAVLMLLGGDETNNNEIIAEGRYHKLVHVPGVEVYSTAGDPRREFSNPQAGEQYAAKRVAAMAKQYPHTWEQGPVQAQQYPYPQGGPAPPPPKTVVPTPRDAAEAAEQTDSAVVAVDKSRAVMDSKVPEVEESLGRMGNDLTAHVPVPPSVAPKVPTPPKDLLSKVVPVPQTRRTVTWQQAQVIKAAVHAKALQDAKAKVQKQLNRPVEISAESQAAGVKELHWKPAYRKAQAEAAAKRDAAMQRADEARKRAAEKAEKDAEKEKQASERSEKHDEVAANIQDHMNALRTLVPGMTQISTSMHEDEDSVQTEEIRGKQAEKVKAKAKAQAVAAAAAAQKVQEDQEDAAITVAQKKQEQEDAQRVERLLARQAEGTAIDTPPGTRASPPATAKELTKWNEASEAVKKASFDRLKAETARTRALAYTKHEKQVLSKAATSHIAATKKTAQYDKVIAETAAETQAVAARLKADADAEHAAAVNSQLGGDNAKMITDTERIQAATAADQVASEALKDVASFRKAHPKVQAEAREMAAHNAPAAPAPPVAAAAAPPVLASAAKPTTTDTSSAAANIAPDTNTPEADHETSEVEEEIDDEADDLERASAGSREEMTEVLEQAWESKKEGHFPPPLVLLQEEKEIGTRPSLEKQYPWLRRVVQATDPAIEARTVATMATAARIRAEREALQATGASLTLDSEAQQGMRRLDALHHRLASMEPDRPENGDEVQPWTAKNARGELLRHAMANAQSAFAATEPAYDNAVGAQKTAEERKRVAAALAKQQAVQKVLDDYSKRAAAHNALVQKQAQDATQEAARAAQEAAEHQQEALAEKSRLGEEARYAAAAQADISATNAREGALMKLVAKYRAEAPPIHPRTFVALRVYMPMLHTAILRGAPVAAVAQLIERVERLGPKEELKPPLAQQVQHIATTLQGMPRLPQDQDPNSVSMEELRRMQQRGRQLNMKQVHELARDVAPQLDPDGDGA